MATEKKNLAEVNSAEKNFLVRCEEACWGHELCNGTSISYDEGDDESLVLMHALDLRKNPFEDQHVLHVELNEKIITGASRVTAMIYAKDKAVLCHAICEDGTTLEALEFTISAFYRYLLSIPNAYTFAAKSQSGRHTGVAALKELAIYSEG